MIPNLTHFIRSIIFVIFGIALTGCSTSQVEYVEKKVPVKCEVKKTQLPAYADDPLVDVPNILIYTEVIEEDLRFCTQGTTKN